MTRQRARREEIGEAPSGGPFGRIVLGNYVNPSAIGSIVPRMDFTRLTTPERLSLGSMVVVVIAAFLPWVSLFGISKRGTAGDGAITLILALVGIVVLAVSSRLLRPDKRHGKPSQITLIVLAAVVAIIGIADMNGAAAIGLYLTLFAGIAWVVGAVWQLSSGSRRSSTDPS